MGQHHDGSNDNIRHDLANSISEKELTILNYIVSYMNSEYGKYDMTPEIYKTKSIVEYYGMDSLDIIEFEMVMEEFMSDNYLNNDIHIPDDILLENNTMEKLIVFLINLGEK